MQTGTILPQLTALKKNNSHAFAVLIDPDSVTPESIALTAQRCNENEVDFVFVGGSIMVTAHVDRCIQQFKEESDIPVLLFPRKSGTIISFRGRIVVPFTDIRQKSRLTYWTACSICTGSKGQRA